MNENPQQYQVQVEWENNPYDAPFAVNQIMASSGLDTQFGPDGLIYLKLGHVVPPFGVPSDETLRVNSGGTFVFTAERARELHTILSEVLRASEDIKNHYR